MGDVSVTSGCRLHLVVSTMVRPFWCEVLSNKACAHSTGGGRVEAGEGGDPCAFAFHAMYCWCAFVAFRVLPRTKVLDVLTSLCREFPWVFRRGKGPGAVWSQEIEIIMDGRPAKNIEGAEAFFGWGRATYVRYLRESVQRMSKFVAAVCCATRLDLVLVALCGVPGGGIEWDEAVGSTLPR